MAPVFVSLIEEATADQTEGRWAPS